MGSALIIGIAVASVTVCIVVLVTKRRNVRRPSVETEEHRLHRLRELQRAEKVREAREEALGIDTRPPPFESTTEDEKRELRLAALREFQRVEKAREAAEEAERSGPQQVREPEPAIGSLIAQELVDLHRKEQEFEQHAHRQKQADRAEVDRVVAEARDLIVDLNAQFGWTPGEPSIADRMFNTDVESVLGAAISKGRVDFRTHAMVASMRHFARAATGGRNEIAEVMATRALLGSGKLTEEELKKIDDARRLFGDNFAEASGFVDRMTRSQELIIARQLGLRNQREQQTDRDHGRQWSIADRRESL